MREREGEREEERERERESEGKLDNNKHQHHVSKSIQSSGYHRHSVGLYTSVIYQIIRTNINIEFKNVSHNNNIMSIINQDNIYVDHKAGQLSK